jgi:hypothetical protein
MRRLFADAFYWIALLHEGDQWHQRVIQLTETLDEHHMYPTFRTPILDFLNNSGRNHLVPTFRSSPGKFE